MLSSGKKSVTATPWFGKQVYLVRQLDLPILVRNILVQYEFQMDKYATSTSIVLSCSFFREK